MTDNYKKPQQDGDTRDEVSMWDILKNSYDKIGCLSKKEIHHLHQEFIDLARNRSDFNKLRSKNKYKIREKFDDQLR